MRNLKVICRSVGLLNKNTGGFLCVLMKEVPASSVMFKCSEKQSLLQLAPVIKTNHIYNRSIHSSVPNWAPNEGDNLRKEKRDNYIFFLALGGICVAMFTFSMTMRSHEDYVVVNPNVKKNS